MRTPERDNTRRNKPPPAFTKPGVSNASYQLRRSRLVSLYDATRDTPTIADRVAVGSSPLTVPAEVKVTLGASTTAGGSTGAGGPDRPGGVNERRQRLVELVGIAVREVNLVRAAFNGEADLISFTLLENGAVEVVRDLRNVFGSHDEQNLTPENNNLRSSNAVAITVSLRINHLRWSTTVLNAPLLRYAGLTDAARPRQRQSRSWTRLLDPSQPFTVRAKDSSVASFFGSPPPRPTVNSAGTSEPDAGEEINVAVWAFGEPIELQFSLSILGSKLTLVFSAPHAQRPLYIGSSRLGTGRRGRSR